jgi:hypothetical protein
MNNLDKLLSKQIGILGDFVSKRSPKLPAYSDIIKNTDLMLEEYNKMRDDTTKEYEHYFVTIMATSYFLCGRKEMSSKLARKLDRTQNMDAGGLEYLLIWLLQYNYRDENYCESEIIESEYLKPIILDIMELVVTHTYRHNCSDFLLEMAKMLEDYVYNFGNPRELFFGDIIKSMLLYIIKQYR